MAKREFGETEEKYPARKGKRVREGGKKPKKPAVAEREDEVAIEPVLVSESDAEVVRRKKELEELRKRDPGNDASDELPVPAENSLASEKEPETINDSVAPTEKPPEVVDEKNGDKLVGDEQMMEKEWRDKYDFLIDKRLYFGDNWIQIKAHNFLQKKLKLFSNLGELHNKIISQDDLEKLREEYKLKEKKKSERKFVKEKKMDLNEALRDIDLKKGERLRAITKGDLRDEWAEDAHELFVIIPPHALKFFDLMAKEDKNKIIDALDLANKEIETAWNVWKKSQGEKEITAEDIEVFLEVANEHRKRLNAEYEKVGLLKGYSERRKRDLLDVKTAKFLGDRFQETFGVSQEKAEELADKIMGKVEV